MIWVSEVATTFITAIFIANASLVNHHPPPLHQGIVWQNTLELLVMAFVSQQDLFLIVTCSFISFTVGIREQEYSAIEERVLSKVFYLLF